MFCLEIALGEDVVLTERKEIYITKKEEIIAKPINPFQDRIDMAKSLFGILPADITLKS